MKKHLGITKFVEKDVPRNLDAVILSHAAIALRKRKQTKTFRIVAAAAAMMIALTGTGISFYSGGLQRTIQPRNADYSSAELLAMTDFTILEQENFALDSMTSAGENMIDNYI